jgi:penicillin-binding protein 2
VGTSGDVYRPKLYLRTLPVGAVPAPYAETGLTEPVRKVSLRERTWRAIQEGMFRAVNQQGTAGRARVEGIAVAGKTGTAQVASRTRIRASADERRPEHLRNHAWFVGFAPRVNPEIAIAVLVEHGGGGAAAAAPIAQKIFQTYFDGQREERVTNGPRQTTMALH